LARPIRIDSTIEAMHLGRGIVQDADRPILVASAGDALEDVAERAVAEIVKQRGGGRVKGEFGIDGVHAREAVDDAPRQMTRADRVREAAVLGALKGVMREPELADAAETLHLGRIDQADEESILRRVLVELDQAVEGIAEETLLRADLESAAEDVGGGVGHRVCTVRISDRDWDETGHNLA
jgi:hypothetical protein